MGETQCTNASSSLCNSIAECERPHSARTLCQHSGTSQRPLGRTTGADRATTGAAAHLLWRQPCHRPLHSAGLPPVAGRNTAAEVGRRARIMFRARSAAPLQGSFEYKSAYNRQLDWHALTRRNLANWLLRRAAKVRPRHCIVSPMWPASGRSSPA